MNLKTNYLNSLLLAVIIVTPILCHTQTTTRYGALAIDKSNGYYYGFSYDYTTLSEAQSKAISECKAKGGNCALVLCWSGTGCGVYRTIEGDVGTAYGWGVAKTKAEADEIATAECLQRSDGIPALNHVWSCNGLNSGPLKIIYNAGTNSSIPNNSTTTNKDPNTNAVTKPTLTTTNDKTVSELPKDLCKNGFTNKAEAENKTVNGKKEGKWYESKIENYGDADYPTEHLIVYTNGFRCAEKSYVNGQLDYEVSYPKQGMKVEGDDIVKVLNEYSKGRLFQQDIEYGNGKKVLKRFGKSGVTNIETTYPDGTKTNGIE